SDGGMLLYFRINGKLHEVARYPREMHQPVVNRWKIMAECSLNERSFPQEGRIGISHRQKDYDLRVIVLPTLFGERVTAHVQGKSALPTELSSLGLSPAQVEAARGLIERPSGLVAVAGPAGSGRTTLLYLLLNEIHAQAPDGTNILTVEDPVEC